MSVKRCESRNVEMFTNQIRFLFSLPTLMGDTSCY